MACSSHSLQALPYPETRNQTMLQKTKLEELGPSLERPLNGADVALLCVRSATAQLAAVEPLVGASLCWVVYPGSWK